MSDHFLFDQPPSPSTHSAGPPPKSAHAANGALPADGASPPPDVSLLLRAHAERRWLSREVVPVLRQIETSIGLPDEQLPAAVAYLEVIWTEALSRARETDAERRRLDARAHTEQPLLARAHRYHATVRDLRDAVTRRVARLLAPNVALHL